MRYLKTSEVAQMLGVHPNTVRMYEKWGLLPPIPRASNGYRQFREYHVDQMRLARLALHTTFLSGNIRQTAMQVIQYGRQGQLKDAYFEALTHLQLIQRERAEAEEAVQLVESWAMDSLDDNNTSKYYTKEIIELIGISFDSLRNWERNGLIKIPRDPQNGYRVFGDRELKRLKVIRALRRARYSLMSILRMLNSYDQGQRENLRAILDTPNIEDDIIYATDHWLTTLADLEVKSQELIDHIKMMVEKQKTESAYLSVCK